MSEQPALEFDLKPGCLRVMLRGRDIIQQKATVIQAIADELKRTHRRAALVDARAVPGPLSFMDRFQLGTTAGRYLAGTAIGVLARSDQADPHKIGQLVARNRGVDVEVFTEATLAETWMQRHGAKA